MKNQKFTDDQKLVIDVNREWLKSDHGRSVAVEKKISWILLTHATIFVLINTIFGTCTGLAQILCIVCFLLYGVSFLLSIFALSPVTMYYDTWNEELSFSENNRNLCRNVEETRSSVNKQCYRFKLSQRVFFIATVFMVGSLICIMINKTKWSEDMKTEKKNFADVSSSPSKNPKDKPSKPSKNDSSPKPIERPSVPDKVGKTINIENIEKK
jgi:hypothetical protein